MTDPMPAGTWLIGTDLDGTIVRPDKTVAARTVQALRERVSRGDRILFLTGRSPFDDVNGLPLDILTDGVIVCANGAVDLEPRGGGVTRVETIGRAQLREVAGVCRTHFPGGWFCADSLAGTIIERGHPWRSAMAAQSECVDDVLTGTDANGQDPFKVTYLHPTATVEDMAATVGQRLEGLVSVTYGSSRAPCFLEFAAHGVSKGQALARHAARLGVPRERIVSFGDMPNDVSMFEVSGQSWAMADAPQAVQHAASGVTTGVMADGVAEVLDRLGMQTLTDEQWRPMSCGEAEQHASSTPRPVDLRAQHRERAPEPTHEHTEIEECS